MTQSAQTYIYTLYQYIYILQYPHHLEVFQPVCYANWLIGLWMIWTLSSKCIILTLFIYYYLLYLSIYLLCYIYFCLLILLVLLFAVVDVVVVYSFLTSFYCCCSGFSMYFTFLWVMLFVVCCLCCHSVLQPYNPFVIITLYLLLFKLFTHCHFAF